MHLHQKTLSRLLRSLAALALFVFVLAQAMCFVHSNFGGGHGDKAQPFCHSSPQHPASHNDDDYSAPSIPSPTAAYSMLKALLTGGDAPMLTEFQAQMLYLLHSVVLAFDATETQRQVAYGHQTHSHEWTLTLEVCLGRRSAASLLPSSVKLMSDQGSIEWLTQLPLPFLALPSRKPSIRCS